MKNLSIHFGEIVSHNSHEIHVRKKAGRYGKISGRAAQRPIHFPIRTFQSVECDGTHNE